jgi:hypothetical protein
MSMRRRRNGSELLRGVIRMLDKDDEGTTRGQIMKAVAWFSGPMETVAWVA